MHGGSAQSQPRPLALLWGHQPVRTRLGERKRDPMLGRPGSFRCRALKGKNRANFCRELRSLACARAGRLSHTPLGPWIFGRAGLRILMRIPDREYPDERRPPLLPRTDRRSGWGPQLSGAATDAWIGDAGRLGGPPSLIAAAK